MQTQQSPSAEIPGSRPPRGVSRAASIGSGAHPKARTLAIARRDPDVSSPACRDECQSPDQENANYYELLQIKPYANTGTIRGAYRQVARQAHPDVNRAPDATQQMQVFNEAYAVLRDPSRRAAYDRARFARALQEAEAGLPSMPPTGSRPDGNWRRVARRALEPVRAAMGIAMLVFAAIGLAGRASN
jgi:hypothetical protein